ncbi:MAG: type II toxin-antitoxin system PemK/MazF family toxin [Ignavibacteria bacterium]|nr:type II toxin-antitoxin system PemK/MazF family toxin [Ignavibacteria bacterium]
MKRGTIILTPFPFTDLSKNKVRPALIVSSNNRKDNDVIIAFISSVVEPDNLSQTDILLDSKDIIFKETGLKTTSVIRTEKLATIDKKLFPVNSEVSISNL